MGQTEPLNLDAMPIEQYPLVRSERGCAICLGEKRIGLVMCGRCAKDFAPKHGRLALECIDRRERVLSGALKEQWGNVKWPGGA